MISFSPTPIPMRSRAARCALVALACITAAAGVAHAQRVDTARVAAARSSAPAKADSLRPPLSPRRAFLYSFLAPGYSQSILRRHKAAAIMLFVEAMSVAMIRESAADVAEARRMRGDSLVISYMDDASGGLRTTPLIVTRRFDEEYVKARQSHVEDWIALLVANHLFAGADAYVAANLWDVPAQLSVRNTPHGPALVASLSW
jgi:hypothetical protein